MKRKKVKTVDQNKTTVHKSNTEFLFLNFQQSPPINLGMTNNAPLTNTGPERYWGNWFYFQSKGEYKANVKHLWDMFYALKTYCRSSVAK